MMTEQRLAALELVVQQHSPSLGKQDETLHVLSSQVGMARGDALQVKHRVEGSVGVLGIEQRMEGHAVQIQALLDADDRHERADERSQDHQREMVLAVVRASDNITRAAASITASSANLTARVVPPAAVWAIVVLLALGVAALGIGAFAAAYSVFGKQGSGEFAKR